MVGECASIRVVVNISGGVTIISIQVMGEDKIGTGHS
jgi:hypothetical protein